MGNTRDIALHMGDSGVMAGATLPPGLASLIEETRKKKPGLFGLPEHELEKVYENEEYEPPHVATMLRIRFWDEYERSNGHAMSVAAIYVGICPEPSFRNVMADVWHLSWILCPMASLAAEREADVRLLAKNLRRTLSANPMGSDGKLDKGLMRLQLELLMYYDQKLTGMAPQKIEETKRTVNTNVNVTATPEQLAELSKLSAEELQKRMDDARARVEKKMIEVRAE